MNQDKKIRYLLSIMIPTLLLALFVFGVGSSKVATACLLLPLTGVTVALIKKRGSLSINKKEVLLFSAIMALICAMLTEITGLHFGFYKNPYFVNAEYLLWHILPAAIIIVETEIIRFVMLSQKDRFASIMAYVSCVLAEMLMTSNAAGVTGHFQFMDLVALTLFPAIGANVYYHYVSKRYGMLPNITFRLITTLYIYFIPTTTGMNDVLISCIRIFFPLFMLLFTMALFEKRRNTAVKKGRAVSHIGTVFALLLVVLTAMLVSCQFRYGALVIATESMTGEINKGDMIIYEAYDGQKIEEGQVIVFLQNQNKIVHRVIRIDRIENETRYYTKGDANESEDAGYITQSDIFGLTDFKISGIGYPTLWLREIMNK